MLMQRQYRHRCGSGDSGAERGSGHEVRTPERPREPAFNLADLFECVADHVPEREALVQGTRRATYRQLDEAATRVAHGLAQIGIGPGDHVGIALFDCIEHVETILACYKLRAVPVNVNHRYVA